MGEQGGTFLPPRRDVASAESHETATRVAGRRWRGGGGLRLQGSDTALAPALLPLACPARWHSQQRENGASRRLLQSSSFQLSPPLPLLLSGALCRGRSLLFDRRLLYRRESRSQLGCRCRMPGLYFLAKTQIFCPTAIAGSSMCVFRMSGVTWNCLYWP